MEKVKIKRVARNHKAVTTKEKLVAGFGVGATLLGGGMGGAVKNVQQSPIVRSMDNSKAKSGGSILKKFWDNTFGANEAQAAGLNLPAGMVFTNGNGSFVTASNSDGSTAFVQTGVSNPEAYDFTSGNFAPDASATQAVVSTGVISSGDPSIAIGNNQQMDAVTGTVYNQTPSGYQAAAATPPANTGFAPFYAGSSASTNNAAATALAAVQSGMTTMQADDTAAQATFKSASEYVTANIDSQPASQVQQYLTQALASIQANLNDANSAWAKIAPNLNQLPDSSMQTYLPQAQLALADIQSQVNAVMALSSEVANVSSAKSAVKPTITLANGVGSSIVINSSSDVQSDTASSANDVVFDETNYAVSISVTFAPSGGGQSASVANGDIASDSPAGVYTITYQLVTINGSSVGLPSVSRKVTVESSGDSSSQNAQTAAANAQAALAAVQAADSAAKATAQSASSYMAANGSTQTADQLQQYISQALDSANGNLGDANSSLSDINTAVAQVQGSSYQSAVAGYLSQAQSAISDIQKQINTIGVLAPANAAKTPTQITISGGNSQTINQGSSFTNPAATVSYSDGSTSTIYGSGSVNTNTPNTYYVTYSVNGLAPVTLAVTVVAVQTSAPTITLVGGNMTLNVGDSFEDPGAMTSNSNGQAVGYSETGSVDTTKAGSYVLTYTVYGGSAFVTRTVTVAAANIAVTTPPTINVSVGNLQIALNATYTAPSATATDAKGNNISSSITVSNNVNTQVAGNYSITYSVTDQWGNTNSVSIPVTVSGSEASEVQSAAADAQAALATAQAADSAAKAALTNAQLNLADNSGSLTSADAQNIISSALDTANQSLSSANEAVNAIQLDAQVTNGTQYDGTVQGYLTSANSAMADIENLIQTIGSLTASTKAPQTINIDTPANPGQPQYDDSGFGSATTADQINQLATQLEGQVTDWQTQQINAINSWEANWSNVINNSSLSQQDKQTDLTDVANKASAVNVQITQAYDTAMSNIASTQQAALANLQSTTQTITITDPPSPGSPSYDTSIFASETTTDAINQDATDVTNEVIDWQTDANELVNSWQSDLDGQINSSNLSQSQKDADLSIVAGKAASAMNAIQSTYSTAISNIASAQQAALASIASGSGNGSSSGGGDNGSSGNTGGDNGSGGGSGSGGGNTGITNDPGTPGDPGDGGNVQ